MEKVDLRGQSLDASSSFFAWSHRGWMDTETKSALMHTGFVEYHRYNKR
jgi:hypothetical protein